MAPQPGRNDCCRSCLRGSLRGLNYLLAIVGVLMTAYALFMWVQWEEATKPDTPTPPPASVEGLSHFPQRAFGMKSSAASIIADPLDGVVLDERLTDPESQKFTDQPENLYQPTGTGDDPSPPPAKTIYPWFIYIFGGAGVFVFITASIGIISADCAACGVTCFLGLYHALMVLMLLLQIAVVCFYFFDKSWESDLPADSTGEYEKLKDIIVKHMPACKIAALATLGLQLLSLTVSCSLYYAEGRPSTQARLDHRALDRGHPYHPIDYETASQQGSHAAARRATLAGPSNGNRYDREIAERYPRKPGGTPTRRGEPGSPSAPPGPSRLAIANEQAAATGGYDEDAPAAGAGEDEAVASPDAKGGNCAIM